MLDTVIHIAVEIWTVTAHMANWLLLGFLIAGLLSVFISPAWLERHLGGGGAGPVFKASLFGVPLPLCSCGVIPVAASLRQQGASRAATTAFLLSTPQTGVDSILVTWSMLGPLFAVFRPVIALVTGFVGGGLVQAVEPSGGAREDRPPAAPMVPPRGLVPRLRAALDYGFVTLPGDIGRALLVGVVVAGLLSALIPEDFLAGWLGSGPAAVALMMVAGIPIYVCATASVPLAASFIFLGASPGAALAFLVAGPATNAATIVTVDRVLGRRTVVIYLATVAASAFGGGLLLDWLVPRAAEALPALAGQGHQHGGIGWHQHLGAAVLVAVMTGSWWLTRRRGCGCDDTGASAADAASGPPLTLAVDGMHCSHCVESVERSVGALDGVTACRVVLADGRVVVEGRGLDPGAIVRVVEGLGFKVRPLT